MKVIYSVFPDDDFDHQDMFDGARFGPAILAVIEDDDGRMYVFNGEYASRVNYCPFTGQRATVQISWVINKGIEEDNLFMIEYVKCYSEVKEYLELLDSPANGWGQHVHPRYGQSHIMLRHLYNKYGEEAVRMEIDNQQRNRR